MNESFFELSQSENVIEAINTALDAIRTHIRSEMRQRIFKYKWAEKIPKHAALELEFQINTSVPIRKWIAKVQGQAKDLYTDSEGGVFDEWMLDSLLIFDVEKEIRILFELEWEIAKNKPSWVAK